MLHDKEVATPSAAVTNDPVFISIEMSRSKWVVGAHVPTADKVSIHVIEWGDITALLALIERLRARAAAALGFNVPILCCYEAGYEGFWVYRLMTAAGHRVLIIDPASPLVNRRAKRAKTDRIDAKTMVRALMAFNRGEHQVLSAVNEEMDGSEETMIASLARIRGVARMTHQCFSRSFLARIQESARNRRLERFRSDTVGERSCKQRSGHH